MEEQKLLKRIQRANGVCGAFKLTWGGQHGRHHQDIVLVLHSR